MLTKTQLKATGRSKPRSLIIWSLFLLVTTVIITSYLTFRIKSTTSGVSDSANGDSVGIITDKSVDTWVIYKNDMFNYKIEYPDSLVVRQLGSGGGYIDFVRFEESSGGDFKGFAVGVSEQTFTNEIDRIKKIFESESAYLVQESTIDTNGMSARRLYYKPQKIGGGEERIIVIFSDGQYTYSVSTAPGQINEIMGRFEFIN